MQHSVQALALSCKSKGTNFTVRVFDGTRLLDAESSACPPEGSLVKLESAEGITRAVPANDARALASLTKSFNAYTAPHEFPPWIADDCTNALLPSIRACAGFLKKHIAAGTPFFLRYNADTDGICGGLLAWQGLKEVAKSYGVPLRTYDVPSPPAIYEKPKAVREAEHIEEIGGPAVALLIDHAANPESMGALSHLKGLGFPIVVLDHHPPDPRVTELAEYFISPFTVPNVVKPSQYTAGYLCFELSRALCGTADERLLSYSLIADASGLTTSREFSDPLAIDFYAQTTPHARLEEYAGVVANPEELKGLALRADKLLMQATERAWSKASIENVGLGILIYSDFTGVIRRRTFPSKGAVLNLVQSRANSLHPNTPIITVCSVGDSIGFRANSFALEHGFHAHQMIQRIRADLPHVLKNGGGHAGAASLQVREEGDRLPVLERCLQLIREQLAKIPKK